LNEELLANENMRNQLLRQVDELRYNFKMHMGTSEEERFKVQEMEDVIMVCKE
jgi:hypothetical protein